MPRGSLRERARSDGGKGGALGAANDWFGASLGSCTALGVSMFIFAVGDSMGFEMTFPPFGFGRSDVSICGLGVELLKISPNTCAVAFSSFLEMILLRLDPSSESPRFGRACS